MNKLEEYRLAFRALSELYVSMHIFDLATDTYSTLKTNEHILKWTKDLESTQEVLTNVMARLASLESLEEILDFTTLSTLPERLKDKSVISCVFRGQVHGWCSAKFIRIGEEDPVRYVLYAVESVDDQVKELEELRKSLSASAKLQEVVDALTEEYNTVCDVNLAADRITVLKLFGHAHTSEELERETHRYSVKSDEYLNQGVHVEDRDYLRTVMRPETIRKRLEITGSFSEVYRNNAGKYGEMKVIRTGQDTVLMGFAEKHDEIVRLQNQIYVDSLSQLRNRKFLNEVLMEKPCQALVMADIDHFKEINDGYGHQVGDLAITAVASALAANIRSNDYAVRYGGDEFTIVFQDIPQGAFEERIESMRSAVKAVQIPGQPDLRFSMSFGGTYGAGTVRELIASADAALYESKKNRGSITVTTL